jgi:GntR family transcriptional regulator
MKTLDRTSFIPLYYQLAQHLREEIADGSLPAGSELPSERKLMEEYDVSRNTVRLAFDQLYRDGLILREQGSGTRVAQPRNAYEYLLNTFLENRELLMRAGYKTSVNVLSSDLVDPSEEVRLALNFEKGEPVIKNKMIFYADDRPAMFTIDFLPKNLEGDYEMTPEGAGYLKFLDRKSGQHVEFVIVDLSPEEATGEVAETFNCKTGSPVLLMKEVFLDESQQVPIAYSLNYFNREIINFRLLTRRG